MNGLNKILILSELNNWELFGIGWLVLAVITFVCLFAFKIVAPFGRHTRTDWGPMINNTLGWILMEAISLIMLWVGFALNWSNETPKAAFLPMALWSVHYINRTFIYPLRLKNKKKKMPLVIMSSAIFFNVINGGFNGLFLGQGWFVQSEALIVIGCIVFFSGMYINIKSDNILLGLRKPGETGYTLPKGFLFDKITAPNLFGETIEWIGFFIVAPSIASLSFCVWTMANLVPRARDHHEWSLKRFKDYPKERKVMFPGIW